MVWGGGRGAGGGGLGVVSACESRGNGDNFLPSRFFLPMSAQMTLSDERQ
ncbi:MULTISPECIES: hypothetical protein [Eisenbergiella]|nr:hypothetical protein [Eisenbergiella porci]